MTKKLNFELVPLDEVKKVLEEQIKRVDQGTKAQKLKRLKQLPPVEMLDIFRLESCGVFWRGSAESLERAKAHVHSRFYKCNRIHAEELAEWLNAAVLKRQHKKLA